jgi:hypothetical protein
MPAKKTFILMRSDRILKHDRIIILLLPGGGGEIVIGDRLEAARPGASPLLILSAAW